MRRHVVVLFLLLPGLAVAQPPQLAPGQQVRATAREFGLVRAPATIEAVAGDTLVLRAGATRLVPLASVERLEVRTGRRSHWLLGGGVGFVVGAGVTYAVLSSGGSTALCNRSQNQDAMSTGECLGLAAAGGVVGAGLGALVGAFIKSDRWEDVAPDRFRLGLAPRPTGGLTLSASVAF
jgi:hypothetical protein